MIPGVVIFSLEKFLLMILQEELSKSTLIALLVALTNFGLNIWLVPIYGIKGAALATSVSYILDTCIKSVVFSIKNKEYFRYFSNKDE